MVSDRYPPGTSTSDLERAGIIDTSEPCPECGEPIGDGSEHEEGCPEAGTTADDIREAEEARHQERKMEQRRLERRSDEGE
jgi:uncharacterized Zn finger protein (UPF0148 family)